MSAGGLGSLVFAIIGGIIAFAVAVIIMRAVFSIGKIVRLLEVIAQELRVRNLADGAEDKLDLTDKEVVDDLNDLRAGKYEQEAIERPDDKGKA